MSVSATNVYDGPFTPNGATAAFAFTFKAVSGDEVAVEQVIDGVRVTISPALYDVAVNAGDGGSVTFTAAPSTGSGEIYIVSAPDFTQQQDFTASGPFSPRALNALFDRAATRALYLKDSTDRALVFPRGEDVPAPAFTMDELNALVQASFSAALAQLAANIGYLPSGSGAVLRDLQEKLREAAASPDDFGAVGDGVTDDYAALQKWLDRGGLLLLPARAYRTSQRLKVTKQVHIVGGGLGFDGRQAGYPGMPGSRIVPDENISGIIFYTQTQLDDEAAVAALGPAARVQEGAYGSIVEGVAFIGSGASTTSVGVETRTVVTFRNVTSFGFGKGFDINGSLAPDAGSDYGNVSMTVLERCEALESNNIGFHNRGADASVVKFDTCNASFSGGWGYVDEGLLGNTYVNCHAASNNLAGLADADEYDVGSFKATSLVAPHAYIGCYIEPFQGAAPQITDICSIIGGSMAREGIQDHGGSSALQAYGSMLYGGAPTFTNTSGTVDVQSTLGGPQSQPGNFAFTFGSADEANRYNYKFYYNGVTGWWALNYLSTADLVQYPNQVAAARAYAPSFPQGIFLGTNAAGPRIVNGTAVPASGTWQRGDLVINSNASIGSPTYWQCTVSGAPGTWGAGPNLA